MCVCIPCVCSVAKQGSQIVNIVPHLLIEILHSSLYQPCVTIFVHGGMVILVAL